MNVLKQFNLTQRPSLRVSSSLSSSSSSSAPDGKEGVVINFVRKLPSGVFKKPRNVSGYATMRQEREDEFAPELPVEGTAATGPAGGEEASVGAVSASNPPTSFVVDKRHTVEFDRASIMAKLRGSGSLSTVVVPLEPPSFSDVDVRRPEIEPIEFETGAAPAAATAVVKLGKRAILPSDELPKQTKASAALAIAEANEPVGFDEMRQLDGRGGCRGRTKKIYNPPQT